MWGEVVHQDKAEARFIGDMSHGWVGSDFVRSVGFGWEQWSDGASGVRCGSRWRPESYCEMWRGSGGVRVGWWPSG